MRKILLVEDDLPLLRLYQGALEADFEVLVAGTAAEARQALESHRPSVVVLDLNLPDAPGATIIRYIEEQESLAHTRVVVMTGFHAQRQEGNSPVVIETIAKPVTASILLRVVKLAAASAARA
jgi:DNA-binding response OmpR family regulator